MKKKQKAEPEIRRKSSYKGNSGNNSKSGGLTFSEKKRLIQLKHILSGKSNEKEKPTTAQKTITFEKMFRDGICQVSHRYYTKMVEFFDINYSLLEVDEQADILAQYSKLINYFDPSVRFELVLFNRQVNEQMLTEQFDIPWQEDDFNDIREEYTEMLKKQAAKGNNGIIKSKYLIFGVESNGYKEAKSRLNNIEKDVIRNLNNIGTLARGLDGKERLRILHEYFNQDTMEPFRFSFKDLAESGKSVKDYIAPPGFDFRYPNRFKSGNMYGCVSYLDIIAPKFTDELIKQLLDIDANLTISMHMQTEDPVKAIKKLKAVISNIQKMKIEEQKKAVRSGYDMDILPTDIVTYEKDTLEFLDDLNTSNQKMINMTFLITCYGRTKRELESLMQRVSGIIQQANCDLRCLQYLQEQGLMASAPIGCNETGIERTLSTKSTAILVPFCTQELFMPAPAIYYGLNALSNNMIMADRKRLRTPNGVILGTPGKDNSAVEGAHKTEQRADDIYHYMKYHRKSKAQRKRDRLERLHKKQVTADMKLEYEKFISENPHLKGNSPKKQLQRQLQKQRIKREYAKARRVGAEAKTAKETFTKTANAATGIAKKLQEIATKNKTLIITVGIFALLLIMIMSALSSCGSMFTGMSIWYHGVWDIW